MGATNKTTALELPQWVGTDKPTWLGDMNDAFLKIDTAYGDIADDAASAVSTAETTAAALTTVSNTATAAKNKADSLENAENINYSNTISGLSATNVQSAIDEIGKVDFIVAEGTSGDWTFRKWNSGLAECFARKEYNAPIAQSGEWANGIFNSDYIGGLAYPFTFMAAPVETVNVVPKGTEGGSCWLSCAYNGANTATNTGTYHVTRPGYTGENFKVLINFTAVGRWK